MALLRQKILAIGLRDDVPYPVGTDSVDWGRLSGQGKRRGHMVAGGMADVTLQGVKTYPNLFKNLPEYEEIARWSEPPLWKLRYWQARNGGLAPHEAALFADEETRS